MACGGCKRKRAEDAAKREAAERKILTSNPTNLNNAQLKTRLENYKKRHCRDCSKRYECDLTLYNECKQIN